MVVLTPEVRIYGCTGNDLHPDAIGDVAKFQTLSVDHWKRANALVRFTHSSWQKLQMQLPLYDEQRALRISNICNWFALPDRPLFLENICSRLLCSQMIMMMIPGSMNYWTYWMPLILTPFDPVESQHDHSISADYVSLKILNILHN